MRSQHLGALALVLVALPLDSHAYTVAYDFHTISESRSNQGMLPPLPDAILNATQWEVVGSILFSDDGREFDDYQVIGGSLSINGVSLGSFTNAEYSLGYFDEPPAPDDDPYSANFAVEFNSEEFGPSFFSVYSEDYSGGIGYGNAISYLTAHPVGGYQWTQVTVGIWPNAFEVFTDIEAFTPREIEGPDVEVSEPHPAPLIVLGLACMLWLRRRGIGWGQSIR